MTLWKNPTPMYCQETLQVCAFSFNIIVKGPGSTYNVHRYNLLARLVCFGTEKSVSKAKAKPNDR